MKRRGSAATSAGRATTLLIMTGGTFVAIREQMSLSTLLAFVASLRILLAPVQTIIGIADPWLAGRKATLPS